MSLGAVADNLVALLERAARHPGHPDQKVHGRKKKLPGLPDVPETPAAVKPEAPKKKAPAARKGSVVRESLASAKNVGQVAAVAAAETKRITGRDTEFDFTGSSLGVAKEHAEGVLRGFERFPTTELAAVRVEKLKNDVMAKVEYRKGKAVLLFSAKESADPTRYRDYQRMEKRYKMKTTGSPMGTAIHEFGHVVANQHKANSRMRTEASRIAIDETVLQSSGFMIRNEISSYATENEYELAAEVFTDVITNGDKAAPLSKRLFAVLEDVVQQRETVGV